MIHVPPHRPLADLRVLRIFRVKTINNQSPVIKNLRSLMNTAEIYNVWIISHQSSLIETCFLTSSACGPPFKFRLISDDSRSPTPSACGPPCPSVWRQSAISHQSSIINNQSSLIVTCILTSSACGPPFNFRLISDDSRSPTPSACGPPYPPHFPCEDNQQSVINNQQSETCVAWWTPLKNGNVWKITFSPISLAASWIMSIFAAWLNWKYLLDNEYIII